MAMRSSNLLSVDYRLSLFLSLNSRLFSLSVPLLVLPTFCSFLVFLTHSVAMHLAFEYFAQNFAGQHWFCSRRRM